MATYLVYTKDVNETKSASVRVLSAAGAETIAATIDADEVAVIVGGSVDVDANVLAARAMDTLRDFYLEQDGKG